MCSLRLFCSRQTEAAMVTVQLRDSMQFSSQDLNDYFPCGHIKPNLRNIIEAQILIN